MTEGKVSMNKNNAIFVITAATIAIFATGCATHGVGYATTYVAEPVYGQPAHVETMYVQPSYVSATIIDDPPPPQRFHGHRHHRDMHAPVGAHRPSRGRPRPHAAPVRPKASRPTVMPSAPRPATKPTQAKPATKPVHVKPSAKPTTKPARPTSGKQGRRTD